MSICIEPFVYLNYCLYLSFTDDSWELLQDSNHQCLSIGLFQFHKKVASTYTKTNNSRDVLAALHLIYASAGGLLGLWKSLTHLRQSNEVFKDVK
jgi:hypothetical protein